MVFNKEREHKVCNKLYEAFRSGLVKLFPARCRWCLPETGGARAGFRPSDAATARWAAERMSTSAPRQEPENGVEWWSGADSLTRSPRLTPLHGSLI